MCENANYERFFGEEEVQELVPFLAMAGFAGARRSELVREYAEDQVLEWEDVDWQKQLITALDCCSLAPPIQVWELAGKAL